MDTVIQVILLLSVVSLTVIFIAVGVWVILILKEFRSLVNRLKEAGEDISETTSFAKEKIKEGLSLATVLAAIGALWSRRGEMEELLLGRSQKRKRLIKGKKEADSNPGDEDVSKPSNSEDSSKTNNTEKSRRFFFRRKK